ncbi:MAG: S8 family peptidase, partial [Sphingobacteriales bacterium]
FNYPFVFDVAEAEEIEDISGADSADPQVEFEILPPDEDAPDIGVIDSGIMEDHRYLRASIRSAFSRSYIDGDNSTADQVRGGGHGTKVAGAVLYPYGVSNLQSPYKLPFFIRNLRVLDGDNALVTKFPALLMKQIVDDNGECKIFNLSLCSKATFRKKHMSAWAATIDSIIYEKDVLFVISAGNIHKDIIRGFINQNSSYPAFLQRPYSRLANPAQSSFALTVGSINHSQFEDANWRSLGGEREVSAFSRIGLGMWGQVKPDVVEFGGGLVVSKDRINTIRSNEHTCPELIRSTLHGGGAYGKDSVGTSFAAPKVSHIVGHLKKLYPNENINLLRALTVQGARLPNQYFLNPTFESIQHYGYGLPSLERVTANTQHRISFYNTGNIKAEEGNIYSLKVPSELRNQANDYDVLIEVTLAFTAKVRRTRQKTKSYLSTWLDWTTSK